ncbi:GDSL-type esterase/lipase family protein [Serratia marcescens]|uniref:GDSL-type esterase/lipase family protein n=1 Tax=Serratia marcescens TaxID=615 RepID=UPI0028814AB3|nr:GDSL-type esterase/lipase family protein [Serratia marcescens]MDT0208093.1 GDSL-type esterase/lipase family protein [Serratia marcescens]
MSVPNQTPYNIYTANGSTTVFPYEFMLLTASDLDVSINGTSITSGYTVQGVGNPGGGDVVFVTPPAADATVMNLRKLPIMRTTDYQDNGDLRAVTLDNDFDRLWMAMQQAFLSDSLSLKRPLFGGDYNAFGLGIVGLRDPVWPQDAANKRWVESQYAIPIEEAKQAAREAKEARDEARAIADKFGDVDRAVEEAGAARDQSVSAAEASKVARDEAEAFAGSIAIEAGTFDTVELGIAGTADGEVFRVPQGMGNELSFVFYRHSGSSAIALTEYPGVGNINYTRALADNIQNRIQGLRTLNYPDSVLEFYDELGHLFMHFNQFAKAFFPHGADMRDGTAKSIILDDGTKLVSADGDKYIGAETDLDNNTIWGTHPVTAKKIYLNRELFNNPGQIFGDAAVCGDSISAFGEFNGSLKPLSWHTWASLNLNGKFWIKGIYATGGATIADIYRAHIPQVIASGATICVLMAGRNDIIDGVDIAGSTIPTFKAAFSDLLRAGIIPVVCTMAAQTNSDSDREREHQLNNWLRSFARRERLPFVDLHAATVNPATGGWLPGYNQDVSHPTETGSKAMGRALSDALDAWIAPVYPTMAEEQITVGLTNNILPNPLFLTLNGAGDAPAGWTTITAGTSSITTDPAVKGNVWHMINAKRTLTVTLTPGEKMGFGFFIRATESPNQQVECYIANGDASSTNYLTGMRTWNRSVDGFSYFYHEFTVPAGVTLGTIVVSAGAVDLYVGQIGLFKFSEV